MENLSLKLNYLKKKFKLTNEKVAKLANIPVATVERISSGRTQNPNLKTLKALANIFECGLDDLINLQDVVKSNCNDETIEKTAQIIQKDEDLKTLFSVIITLSPDNKQAVIGLAQRLKMLQDNNFVNK